MFKLSSAASLDDDSAAEKDAHCPLLLPCTLSSVHPREDEGLEGEARRAWWATQRVAPYNLAQRHAPPTHCRRTSPPPKPPPRHQLTTHRPGRTAFSGPRQLRLGGLPGAAAVYVTVKPHVGASTPLHGRRAIHRYHR